MLASYVWRDLVRNPRRSLAALMGITLGVGLFSAVLFFIDGSSASMTQRAVAPLPIDMQRVLTAPLGGRLHLTQSLDPSGPVVAGGRVTVRLELTNDTAGAANEVVLRSEPAAGFSYVAGSATREGVALPEGQDTNPFAQGAARTGLNLGTLEPGATVTLAYEVRADAPAHGTDGLGIQSSFSTREVITPVRANAPVPVGLHELATRITRVDGVASADELSFADVPAASLSAGNGTPPGTLRLFGFDAGYQRRHDAIDIVDGRQVPGEALISVEAAQALGVAVGDTVSLALPGATAPLRLAISGTTDLSRAKALFYSRQGSNLEDFLYRPNSLVIDPATFESEVAPALLRASASRGSGAGAPVREVDIQVARARLAADPGTALDQTTRIAADVTAVAPEQDYLVDNISNTLGVARADAGVAKRMFVFLGVPGAILAAILSAYAGTVLAAAQRREQAMLRIRGANRRHLLRMLALRTTLLTAVGSALGLGLGLLSALAVLGGEALGRAATPSLIASGLIGAGGGLLATGSALYAAGRGSIRREINEERALVVSHAPRWWRLRLDLVATVAVGVVAVLAVRAHAFEGTPGSVYDGRGVELDLWLLALPVGVWLTGSLLSGRVFAGVLAGLPTRSARFPRLVRGLLARSLRRRSWAAAGGMIVVALILGAATSITAFTASYDRAKAADARFTLGSDIRVTPPATGAQRQDGAFTTELETAEGITGATAVVYGIENSVVRSNRNEDAANVAAVDPSTFGTVAALDDADFVGTTAGQALSALAADPSGVLLSTDMADFISAAPGDPVRILFAQGTPVQASSEMHVIGLFERLPGFPEGADALVDVAHQQQIVPSTTPAFFLARTTDGSRPTLDRAVTSVQAGPGRQMTVETRETTLAKNQSSLAALNILGLLTIDSSYAVAMTTVAIGIFVFGLLLQRRREYVTMRAQGLQSTEIRSLLMAETGAVTVAGCLAGIAVGIGMAYFLVDVLRPLFVLTPQVVLPAGALVGLVLLVVAATLLASFTASGLIGRLKPTELLRDE
jgi:putative ABC transport system permease protein